MKTEKTTSSHHFGRRAAGLIFLLIFLVVMAFELDRNIIGPASQRWVVQSCIRDDEDERVYLQAKSTSDQMGQTFFCTSDQLAGLAFYVRAAAPDEKLPCVALHVVLRDGETKETLFDDIVTAWNVDDMTTAALKLDRPIEDTRNRYLDLTIFFDACEISVTGKDGKDVKSASADAFVVYANGSDLYDNLVCHVNGKRQDCALYLNQFVREASFIRSLGRIFILLLCLFVIGLYILAVVCRVKIWNLYLYAVLGLGILYCLVIVPFGVPDEVMHATTAYRIANQVMRVPETDSPNTIFMRVEDASGTLNNDINLLQYDRVYGDFLRSPENTALVEAGYRDTDVLPVMYAPAVAGIILGRLLGLNVSLMYLLARFLTLLFFALLTRYAVKRMPFGKGAMALIGILPMTLQQAASLSYDAVINALTFLFVGLVFALIFDAAPPKKRDWVLLALLVLFLFFGRGGVYMPLALLVLLIPAQKLGGKKRKWVLFGIVGVLLLALFAGYNLYTHILSHPETAESTLSATGGKPLYTLDWLLHNPGGDFAVLMETFLVKGGFYLNTMIGGRLGFLGIRLDDTVMYAFVALLLISGVSQSTETCTLKLSHRLVMVLSVIGCVSLILVSMWLFYTPADIPYIEGVQGRYFLPMLFVALTVFKNRAITVNRDIDGILIVFAGACHVVAFANIFSTVLYW